MRIIFYIGLIFTFAFCRYPVRNDKARDPGWATEINGTSLHNLFKVNDSIYRSEQPDSKAIKSFDSMGIKSILNLRENHSDTLLMGSGNINYYQVKFITSDFTDKEIIDALNVIKNAKKPLLIHCKHGSDRTGVVIAMYRIVFQHWEKEKALDELVNGGFGFHKIFQNIPNYIKMVDSDSIKRSL